MIEQLEIDGVQALHVQRPGRFRAGLMFRVGQADETLPTRGVTHLVEHLVLFPMNLTEYHANGETGVVDTHFHIEGSASEVVDFFAGVCAGLAKLPLQRLEQERAILRTEESSRGYSPMHPWRYGAQGYGLPGYAEWGNEWLGAAEASAWARERFTCQNAVFWLSGARIPDALRLPLPEGSWYPTPEPTSALPTTPAWFAQGDGVLMNTVLPRSHAATLVAGALGRELFRTLRQEGGWSYQAGTSYVPRDATSATVTAYADAHPGKDDAVLGSFVDSLAKLRAGRLDPADIEAARKQAFGRLDDEEADSERLADEARDVLFGLPVESLEELREGLAAVTLEQVQAVAKEAHAAMLLCVPEGRRTAAFGPAPTSSPHEINGRSYPAIGEPDVALVIGPDGVMLRDGNRRTTVRNADCVARLHWPDGRRVLIGSDGFILTVEPTLFVIDDDALIALDATADRRQVIRRPPRDPEFIPQPPKQDRKGRIDTAVAGLRVARQTRRQPVPDAVTAAPAPVADPPPAPVAKPVPPAAAWLSKERRSPPAEEAEDVAVPEERAPSIGLSPVSGWTVLRKGRGGAARLLQAVVTVSLGLAILATIDSLSKAGRDDPTVCVRLPCDDQSAHWGLTAFAWIIFGTIVVSLATLNRGKR